MNRLMRFAGSVTLLLCGTAAHALSYQLEKVVDTGLTNPVFATSPASDSRLFFIEQNSGAIKIYDQSTRSLQSDPFLTIGGLSTGGEMGLLGLAFHPDYATNGYLYTNSTRPDGTSGRIRTEITRYTRSTTNPNIADPSTAQTILTITRPSAAQNHNAGWLGFGPDGLLYIPTGDGGTSSTAQDSNDTLGKILRVNVDNNNALEILASGLRNPFRGSFDRLTGDLYIGDVGAGTWEEVNKLPAGHSGKNFGWADCEGSCGNANFSDPVFQYDHGQSGSPVQGRSVIGGYVYRGPISELQGKYIFADFFTARIWAINTDGTGFTDLSTVLGPLAGQIGLLSSFGEDSDGNLYIIDYDGEVFTLAPAAVPIPGTALLIVSGLLGLTGLSRRGNSR